MYKIMNIESYIILFWRDQWVLAIAYGSFMNRVVKESLSGVILN